jgi:hypothetical protein
MRNCFLSRRSRLRFDLRRSKLRLDIAAFAAAHAPKRMLRVPAANLAICGVPAAAGTAWSGSAGPIVIAGDRSRSGPADESSGLLQLFLRLSTFAALPWSRCKQRLYGYATWWGRFGRLARLSPTWLAFAALTRLRGL